MKVNIYLENMDKPIKVVCHNWEYHAPSGKWMFYDKYNNVVGIAMGVNVVAIAEEAEEDS